MKIEKYKNNLEYSYSLGITLTIELLKEKPQYVTDVYISPFFNDGEGKDVLLKLCDKIHITPITSEKPFNILSQKENCYVIGVFKKFDTMINDGNHIVLVNPSNAGNLGTIIRSAIGFGIKDIAIIKPAVDIFDPKTVRASMGALFKLNFKYYSSFEEYKKEFNNSIYPFMLKAKKTLANSTFDYPASLIFGNEATGLDDSFLQYNSIIISHSHEIDSLNLPIACSIAIYEFTKNIWNK